MQISIAIFRTHAPEVIGQAVEGLNRQQHRIASTVVLFIAKYGNQLPDIAFGIVGRVRMGKNEYGHSQSFIQKNRAFSTSPASD